MRLKIRMTHDQAYDMGRYLMKNVQWPEWVFPQLEVEYFEPGGPEDPEYEGEMTLEILEGLNEQ